MYLNRVLLLDGDLVFCAVAPDLDAPILMDGDIAVGSEAERNADPCTSRGCMWGKWTDGKVYIPYAISNQYCTYITLSCYCNPKPSTTLVNFALYSCLLS